MYDRRLEQLLPYLKKSGLRITPQRMAILNTLLQLENHPTAEEIHQELKDMSLATVYNNLKLFVKLKILDELPYGSGLSKYEWHRSDHYHVICEDCGKIKDFSYPVLKEIEDAASRLTDFTIRHHHMEIYGKCKDCSEDSAPE
jgi:Fur family transcriptional regulator, peroxide stress response regulator